MKSDSIIPEIKRQITALSSKKQRPVAVKMSERTWSLLEINELASYFGDVDANRRRVCDLPVMFDNALPQGYALVYVHYATAEVFSY